MPGQRTMSGRRKLVLGSLSVAVACLSACASLDKRPATEQVKERAQQRWNALIAGRIADASPLVANFVQSIVHRDGGKPSENLRPARSSAAARSRRRR